MTLKTLKNDLKKICKYDIKLTKNILKNYLKNHKYSYKLIKIIFFLYFTIKFYMNLSKLTNYLKLLHCKIKAYLMLSKVNERWLFIISINKFGKTSLPIFPSSHKPTPYRVISIHSILVHSNFQVLSYRHNAR